MKKLKFLVLVFTIFIIFCLSSCTMLDLRKNKDAKQIALEQFYLDEVYSMSTIGNNNPLLREDLTRYVILVFGRKGQEEKLIAVPSDKEFECYEVVWPFVSSYSEIMEQFTLWFDKDLLKMYDVEFGDNNIEMYEKYNIDNNKAIVPLYMKVNMFDIKLQTNTYCYIFQIDGKFEFFNN